MGTLKCVRASLMGLLFAASCIPVYAQVQDAPSWAVGTFKGYNRKYRADMTLHISRYGEAWIDIRFREGKRDIQNGKLDGFKLTLSGNDFRVARTVGGFRTVQVSEPANEVTYTRISDDWEAGTGGGG